MKKYLNTLYITTQNAYLAKDGQSVIVRVEKETKIRVPIHTISSIVCFGAVTCSPFLMGYCAENNVAISFLSEHGRFLAGVRGAVSGNVLLRREQYRKADDDFFSSKIATAIIAGKIANARVVLRRAMRDHPDLPGINEIEIASKILKKEMMKLNVKLNINELRGIEGNTSKIYFNVFNNLITSQKNDFYFHGRNRRPPLDNVNALLSFIYTILMHDVRGALEAVGLDPAVGFLHKDRPGRYSLALDLMEEFRPFIADRLALSLINLRKINGKGFKKSESGAVLMNDKTKKELLISYQNRKKEEITHPFLNQKMPIGLLFHFQALLLARYLRGDLDNYPPFIWR